MVSTIPMIVTKMKEGRSVKNEEFSEKSKDNFEKFGIPIHAASRTAVKSYNPRNAAVIVPTTMPITGVHSRNMPFAKIPSPTPTRMVRKTTKGAANGFSTPSGTVAKKSNAIGSTVTGINMITTPPTAGVTTFRSQDSLNASANCTKDDTSTSAPNITGPPALSAAMLTAINAPEVPMSNTYPEPIRQNGRACKNVHTPQTNSDAKTAYSK